MKPHVKFLEHYSRNLKISDIPANVRDRIVSCYVNNKFGTMMSVGQFIDTHRRNNNTCMVFDDGISGVVVYPKVNFTQASTSSRPYKDGLEITLNNDNRALKFNIANRALADFNRMSNRDIAADKQNITTRLTGGGSSITTAPVQRDSVQVQQAKPIQIAEETLNRTMALMIAIIGLFDHDRGAVVNKLSEMERQLNARAYTIKAMLELDLLSLKAKGDYTLGNSPKINVWDKRDSNDKDFVDLANEILIRATMMRRENDRKASAASKSSESESKRNINIEQINIEQEAEAAKKLKYPLAENSDDLDRARQRIYGQGFQDGYEQCLRYHGLIN